MFLFSFARMLERRSERHERGREGRDVDKKV
jgi:hypothetical protein